MGQQPGLAGGRVSLQGISLLATLSPTARREQMD